MPGLVSKVIQSLQVVCTRLGSILGVCFCPKMPSKCFYGLIFAMILDYYVHCDICVKCCTQVKMDSIALNLTPETGFLGVVCS